MQRIINKRNKKPFAKLEKLNENKQKRINVKIIL